MHPRLSSRLKIWMKMRKQFSFQGNIWETNSRELLNSRGKWFENYENCKSVKSCSRDYVGEGAYKLWKLDPNSQVLANVVFFGTLNDWNNNKFYQLFYPRILGAQASLEFVTGFLRPSSSKGHFGDWWNFSRIIWKHLHSALMFSQINCIKNLKLHHD